MSAKKYAKNLMDFVKEEDKREKMTVLISSDNKKKIRENSINASKLIDAFLSDFFAELERQEGQKKKPNQPSSPTAPSSKSPQSGGLV